jgi:ABC-2 type transport system ATP-binding protein
VLRFDNLHKSFGAVRALDGCSFEVKRGEMLGFLGPNGSGKTTAMRSVFGLVRPESGDVTWDGSPIGMEQRLRFGYMPEQRGLYPKMKAVDHLAYLCRLHGMSQEGRHPQRRSMVGAFRPPGPSPRSGGILVSREPAAGPVGSRPGP